MSEFAEIHPSAAPSLTAPASRERTGTQAALVRNAIRWRRRLDFIQLREKDLAAGALAHSPASCLKPSARATRAQAAPQLRPTVAIAVAAAGVHLRSPGMTPAGPRSTPQQGCRSDRQRLLPHPDDVARAVSPEPGAGASSSSSAPS